MVPAQGLGGTATRYRDTYYAASANRRIDHPHLAGDLDCDVCVIGGGLAGCSAALNLAERGYHAVLLEAARIGWAASGRSGGQLLAGFGCPMQVLREAVGEDAARRLWQMSVTAVADARRRIAQHAIDCDLADGHLHVALKPRQRQELVRWQRDLEELYGYRELRLIEREELRDLIGSDRYIAGLYDAGGGHLHSLNYALGVAAAASRAGVQIFERSPALRIERGAEIRVHTPGGLVCCRRLVLCGNTSLDDLVPELRPLIMPVTTFMITTEPLGAERARGLIANNAAVADINFILNHYRLTADHRLLFGGGVSYSRLEPRDLAAKARGRMLQVFPQLADVAIDYAWSGDIDITMNRAPHFGRLEDNVYFAQGFSGHGLALTGLAGELIAEAIAGEGERLEAFARIPHRPFPGGRALRTPALVLAMAWYRLRDLL